MQEYYREQQKQKPRKSGGNPFGFLLKLFFKILFSPLIIFVIGYFYFDKDVRKGILVALIAYSIITLFAVLLKIFGLLKSAMTFNIFSFLKKSIDLTIMIISLIIFWFIYSIVYGANFSL